MAHTLCLDQFVIPFVEPVDLTNMSDTQDRCTENNDSKWFVMEHITLPGVMVHQSYINMFVWLLIVKNVKKDGFSAMYYVLKKVSMTF